MTLREQLIRDEGGYQQFAYLDSRGLVTVGYGRCLDSERGKGISQREAAVLLDNDIRDTSAELLVALPWTITLDNVRWAVLVNMAFNLGVAGLLTFKNFLKSLKVGDWLGASEHMLDSKWATQVGQRASRLARQVRTGEWN